MKKCKRNFQLNERGLTLIEVVVSIVLLTLILTIFLSVMIQSKKTVVTSEDIANATYLAQTEMESVYYETTNQENKTQAQLINNVDSDYHKKANDGEWTVFVKAKEDYTIVIKLKEPLNEETTHIIVEVLDKEKGNPLAKMQNVLLWRGSSK